MAKINLKRMGRFELLEMLYEMRKKNLEMTQIVKETRKRADEIQATLDQRVEAVRAEYEKQLEELRQNNSSAQLQERLKSIEQQLTMYQQQPQAQTENTPPAPPAPILWKTGE